MFKPKSKKNPYRRYLKRIIKFRRAYIGDIYDYARKGGEWRNFASFIFEKYGKTISNESIRKWLRDSEDFKAAYNTGRAVAEAERIDLANRIANGTLTENENGKKKYKKGVLDPNFLMEMIKRDDRKNEREEDRIERKEEGASEEGLAETIYSRIFNHIEKNKKR